jgi:hypothetical protein
MYEDFMSRRKSRAPARRALLAALWTAFILPVCASRVVQAEDLPTPPRVIHFCWTNCFTLTFDDGQYRRQDGSDETWTVDRFTSRSVVLRRHDAPAAWNGFSADVTYEGQVLEDRLINVTVNGKPVGGINAAWGMALDTLPGSNAERDRESAQSAAGTNSAPPSSTEVDEGMDTPASVAEAPPPLPDDEQPPCTEVGYLWTPGYWASGLQGYYWVPGLWVQPPRVGVLWTPGYWEFAGRVYVFHPGYWGAHVGYYGGIDYGFGYAGVGYTGGRWVGSSFAYNRSVSNVDMSVIHDTYHETAVNQFAANRASYKGGSAGTRAVPTAEERAAAAEPHFAPTPLQRQLVHTQQVRHSVPYPALVARSHTVRPVIAAAPRTPVPTPPAMGLTHDGAAQTAGAAPVARAPRAEVSTPVVRSEAPRLQRAANAAPQTQDAAGQPGAPKGSPAKPAKAPPARH